MRSIHFADTEKLTMTGVEAKDALSWAPVSEEFR